MSTLFPRVFAEHQFISYYPLKQGLKPDRPQWKSYAGILFISYYPLKQGLKRASARTSLAEATLFISYYPLKQGLKPVDGGEPLPAVAIYILLSIKTRIETLVPEYRGSHSHDIYILLSIKTRIETLQRDAETAERHLFISYYPLKQGLKPLYKHLSVVFSADLYPTIH